MAIKLIHVTGVHECFIMSVQWFVEYSFNANVYSVHTWCHIWSHSTLGCVPQKTIFGMIGAGFCLSLTQSTASRHRTEVKGKGFPYSIPSVGPGADPGVQEVSLQVTVSHPPGGRLPLLSARPAVTSPATEHHRPLAGTKLYCLVTEAHSCKQLA